MSKPLPSQNTFSGLAPPWNLVNLDANTTALWNAVDDLGTYSNYFVDGGVLNALAVTVTSPLTFSLSDGVMLQVKVGNTTTSTTPTLNVASTGAKTIVHSDGTALVVGELVAAMRITVIYDAANSWWRLQSPTFNPGGTFTAPVVINATASQVSLTINGAANQYSENISASSTVGQSLGLLISAGTNSTDVAVFVRNQPQTVSFFQIFGDGHGLIGPNVTNNLNWNTTGNYTVSAPTTGIAFTAVGSGAGVSTFLAQDDTGGFGFNNSTPTRVVTISTVKGWIGSGANVADAAIGARGNLNLYGQNSSTIVMQITGTAISGLGPVAAALVDMTPDASTFNGTGTGFTGGTIPTFACIWAREGSRVTLIIGSGTGTSNANTFTMTGLPAAIQPTHTQACALGWVEDSSIISLSPSAAQVTASGTVTFFLGGNSSGWTNTGTKGFTAAQTISYVLN